MKEIIKQILEKSFSYIYCDTCANYCDDECCDYCHRKNMNWSISEYYAETVADKIIEVLKNEDNR